MGPSFKRRLEEREFCNLFWKLLSEDDNPSWLLLLLDLEDESKFVDLELESQFDLDDDSPPFDLVDADNSPGSSSTISGSSPIVESWIELN